ncbi:MAG: nitroreductase family protein [Bacteroidales bacterium]|nr:nitroreductase family protein [Bacteroidales bacterium]
MAKHKQLSLIIEVIAFLKQLLKYNASVNTDEDIQKMQYTLLRENHVIEKGLSMRHPILGFGKAKVKSLLDRLNKYYALYHASDPDFMIYPLSTIQQYISYTTSQGVQIPEIEQEFTMLVEKTQLREKLHAKCGIIALKKEDVLKTLPPNFFEFVSSRHSIRYFTKEIPDESIIRKALEIAQTTPSACNRQAWMTHIFRGDINQRLIEWQHGAHGFENEIHMSILVTANQKAFLSYESHQVYVDGGLYAMTLMFAIHAQGLGTMPLSCGFKASKLATLHSEFQIPENEVPIVIIGVGCLPDEFNVAASTRKSIDLTTVIHT